MKQADASVGTKRSQAPAKPDKAGAKGSPPSGAKAAARASTGGSAQKTAKPAAQATKKASQPVAPLRKASAVAKPRKTETKVKTTSAAPAKPAPKTTRPAAKPANAPATAKAAAKAPAKATAKAPAKAPAKAASPEAAAKPAAAKAPAVKDASAKNAPAKSEAAKPNGAKAPAAKPEAAKAAPQKPADTKQTDTKQTEAKQVAAKPAPAKPAATKTAAPVPAPAPARAAAPASPEIRKPVIPERPVRAPAKQETFIEGDHVVYPTHGVGKVERIAIEDIAGHRLELIHITFEENRMTLRVPVAKARTAGLRKLATRKLFDEAMTVLKGRARIKRTMWSRRAQEYEAKINSGDPLAVAEVVRDLHRNAGQPDQSFSERQIYEAAMDRLAAELAALDKTDKATAAEKLVEFLKTL